MPLSGLEAMAIWDLGRILQITVFIIIVDGFVIEQTRRGHHELLEDQAQISVDGHLTIFSGRISRELSAEQARNSRDRIGACVRKVCLTAGPPKPETNHHIQKSLADSSFSHFLMILY